MPRLNYEPVIRSFLQLLQKNSIDLFAVDNGEGYQTLRGTSEEKLEQAVDLLTDVDSAWLSANVLERPVNILIIYDGVPSEIIADWSIPINSNAVDLIGAIVDEFTELWDGIPCPTID